MQEINLEGLPNAAITFTLIQAPHFLRRTQNRSKPSQPDWTRISSLDHRHGTVCGTCLTYRVQMEPIPVDQQKRSMRKCQGLLAPVMSQQRIEVTLEAMSYQMEMYHFLRELAQPSATPTAAPLPFPVQFQLQRLAQNGKLRPNLAQELLPEVTKMVSRSGPKVCAHAIRTLWDQLPFNCLQTDVTRLDLNTIMSTLYDNEKKLRDSLDPHYELPDLQDKAHIHRVVFTPSGMQLFGPDPENYNRILRKYRRNHDSFVRVVFCDEDHEPIRFSATWSNDVIYYETFKKVLSDGFSIAGRRFNFLGFSHSSLRSQSCWFMAPFVHEGSLLFDRMLIAGLGDFSQIRCPAKCAARIGQAFSETPVAITLRKKITAIMPDVERNGRVFSDGCGTISQALLEKILAALPPERRGKSRAFQIRYTGK